MISVVPPELTDQIIGHLHNDPSALHACSLTCRAWVITAQAHIFHSVWLALLRPKAFSRLLETSPHIAQYVKALAIEEGQGLLHYEPKFIETIMPVISPKLTNVETLEVTRVTFGELDGSRAVQSSFVQNFPALRKLRLVYSTFETFYAFTSFLLAHPHLENLELQSSGWGRDGRDGDRDEDESEGHRAVSPTTASRLRLRSILLRSATSTSRLVNWMVDHYPTMLLHAVHVPSLSLEDAPAMSRLFHTLGPSLKHLQLCMLTVDGPVDARGKLCGLMECTALRTLHFSTVILSRGGRDTVAWIHVILSQVRSPALEEIVFPVLCNATEELDALELERIDETLSQTRFDGLGRVLFWLYGNRVRAEIGREIKSKMKGLCERGLLVIK